MAVLFAAYAAWENGQLQLTWGGDPPAVLIEAIELLHLAIGSAHAWQDDEREKERKRQSQSTQPG